MKLWLLLKGVLAVGFVAAVVIGIYFGVAAFGYSREEEEAPVQSVPVWGYQCVNSSCQKVAIAANTTVETIDGLQVCRLYCNQSFGTVWPLPTGISRLSSSHVRIDPAGVQFQWVKRFETLTRYWGVSEERFYDQLSNRANGRKLISGGRRLVITVNIREDTLALHHETDESYKLSISDSVGEDVPVIIEARNYFGARHGLETLAQLIVFDDIRRELRVMVNVDIQDAPVFPHRGISLDTARHYIAIDSIKRTIGALAMVKMNTFHWHIADSQSFPLVIKSRPTLHTYGAYSRKHIYTAEDVRNIVEYALALGVRVVPELDAPAHVGEGWEKLDLVSCFNFQPWSEYCEEPPCGQFDPTNNLVYEVLEDVYREMVDMFTHSDVFHMGGDEVRMSCWNSSIAIQQWMKSQGWDLEESDFMKLWNHFQINALEKLEKSFTGNRSIVLWTSSLTEEPYVDEFLNKDRYIIQIWSSSDDPVIAKLLQKGYRLIISNYDALYLDCGFPGWVQGGHNWCSPYKGWQMIYNHDLKSFAGDRISQILGAEAALWMEQADKYTLDARLWPRVSALAERLWTDPVDSWQSADSRMLIQRERLVENGISAESLQPTWCLQNERDCPI